jgi:hypothetical protein
MTEREEFEEAMRSVLGKQGMQNTDVTFSQNDDQEYRVRAVQWARLGWEARATLADQEPAMLTDSECEQIADIINMNRKTLQPPRASADHIVEPTEKVADVAPVADRDAVIEECAKVCDAMAEKFEDQQQFAIDLCSDAIRDLKESK